MYRLTVRYALLSHDPVHRVDEPHGPSSVRGGRAASVVPAASTLDVSIERWVNSKRQESSLTDRFIELRIVFPMAPGTNSTLRWPLGF